MNSKREEERNEKIIRGLMKLPPNRRCINCNSLGPQYVCTNFWTFVCMTCSGIHREFTHRVKSVSMAKFTSQEVDDLQKGGNQRAKELYLKAWDLQRQRLPENSNVEKVREFIKSVYVQKKYSLEKSSDKPPRDPQTVRSHDDETRRASSYHSYSQSPPYDFQYEERVYGKIAPALTRKPGSDRGLYEGKLSSFFSPSGQSDNTNDDRFANEGSNPRVSDLSTSSGGDPFRNDVSSPRSQRDVEISYSETSKDISSKIPQHYAVRHNSDATIRNFGERKLPPQRTASLGSLGSLDSNSMSLKSANSAGLPEVSFKSKQSIELSLEKALSLPYPLQSMESGNFKTLDLFSASDARDVISASPTISNSQMPEASSVQSIDFFKQCPPPVQTLNEQKPLQTLQPSTVDLFAFVPQQQAAAFFNEKTSHGASPRNEGWAIFDSPEKLVAKGIGDSASGALPTSNETLRGNNPFSVVQNPSSQDLDTHKPSVPEPSFWHDCLKIDEGTTTNNQFWNAFEDSARQQPIQDLPKSFQSSVEDCVVDSDKTIGLAINEVFSSDIVVGTSNGSGHPSPFLPSHINASLPDLSMAPVARILPVAAGHKPNNPFDVPHESEMESGSMFQFWEMGALQDALPNEHMPTSYVSGVNQTWFPQNSVAPYVSDGVPFNLSSGPSGFMPDQTATCPNMNITSEGSVASIRGNPFA